MARDKTGHVQRVNTTIGKLGRHPRLCGVIAPTDARVFHVGGVCVMAMSEFGHDNPNFAQIAPRHHRPHVPDQRITGIAIVYRANPTLGAGDLGDLLAFLDQHGHRLFTQHVEPGLKEPFGDFKVGGVGCGDRHQIKAVIAVGFCRQHLAPVAIGAVGSDAQLFGKSLAPCRIMVQRTRDKAICAVKPRAQPVRRPDLAAVTAADHAPIQSCHITLL